MSDIILISMTATTAAAAIEAVSGHKHSKQAIGCIAAVGKKKNVNVGSKGGSAGLDDYKYDTPLDDADDFM